MRDIPITMPHHAINCIVGIILTQTKPFTIDEIVELAEEKLKDTPFAKDGERRSEIDVKEFVEETVETLFVHDYIRAFTENGDIGGDFKGRYKLTMSFPSITRF